LTERILANENLPLTVIHAMRDAGHDVMWIRETNPGATDLEVLEIAEKDNRILATFDKDFGEFIYKQHRNRVCGIILFRLRINSPLNLAKWCVEALESPVTWRNSFSVVEQDRIRIRPLRKT